MSLTRELKNPKSPASLFMRAQFPNTRRVMALSRGRLGQDVQTCRPVGQVPWSLIGTALDYRLRFYFPQAGRKGSVKNLVCYLGAVTACGGTLVYDDFDEIQHFVPPAEKKHGFLEAEVLLDFFTHLEGTLSQLAPAQLRLSKIDETLLLRYCVVMASLDIFYRAGHDLRSILLNPKPKTNLEEFLAVSEDAWVDDLRTLSWNFYDKFNLMLSQKGCLNPTFDGSGFIRGADADLVVDGCLIDIKTTINPLKDASWIYQLLGYVLLDWHDENQIKDVAIYFSRQSFMLKWTLNDLLAELMDEPKSLSELRELWYELIGADHFGKDGTDCFAKELGGVEALAGINGYTRVDGKWKRKSH